MEVIVTTAIVILAASFAAVIIFTPGLILASAIASVIAALEKKWTKSIKWMAFAALAAIGYLAVIAVLAAAMILPIIAAGDISYNYDSYSQYSCDAWVLDPATQEYHYEECS